MTRVLCTRAIFADTIARLQQGGRRGHERLVLWLARDGSVPVAICEVHEPEQETAMDSFYLPPPSMRAVMQHLRHNRLRIVAQVHSHPGAAFHSSADDRWAIVRHVGALSLVLPRFAASTTPDNFLHEAKVYALSPANTWLEVPAFGRDAPIGATA
jgi:hypothetical protein